ncbi:MAG: hypothetical protein AAGI46_08940 [Planctomycetota bacterium]
MSTLAEVQEAIRRMPPEEVAAFRRWWEERDADAWDEQIERDVADGKLDAFADAALEEMRGETAEDVVDGMKRRGA